MNLGYVKVAACTPQIKVADVNYNTESIKSGIDGAEKSGVHVLAFPELCITGCTAGDLFYSQTLLSAARKALIEIAEYTRGKNLIAFLGLPLLESGRLYNVAAAICNGAVLGIVPKGGSFDKRTVFSIDDGKLRSVDLIKAPEFSDIPFGRDMIFTESVFGGLKISVEFSDDLYSAVPPSVYHTANGATVIVNLSASAEYASMPERRKSLIEARSLATACAYVYANAGEGESTTDCVFSGHDIIAENGEIIAESKPFSSGGLVTAEVDVDAVNFERSKRGSFLPDLPEREYRCVEFCVDVSGLTLNRVYDKTPFIKRGEEEFLIEAAAHGLEKRIRHVNASKIVLGLSGGLDSSLALIISVKAMELLKRPASDIISITMPCFGTSTRTFDNSVKLAKAFGASLKKIDITKAVKRHLKDIGHSEDLHDAAYENAQARERTQVLMDVANSCGGLVVGTGDLSELALGWATYNGDHMSMYAVNGSIPKTLVRHLVGYTAEKRKGKIKTVLTDVLDTPVSPELIPSGDKTIKQVTEDIVGPYILHDFFLYSIVKRGFTPKKTYYAAVNTFKGEFDSETVLKWLKIFVRRFFNQQFKRSCMPDGVKVTEISLSPRCGFNMPSDAVSKVWLDELDNIR